MVRIFGHYVPRNTLLIAGLETIILALFLYLALLLWDRPSFVVSPEMASVSATALAAAIVTAMAVMGLYAQPGVTGWRGMLIKLFVALVIGFVLVTIFFAVNDAPPLMVGGPVGGSLVLGFAAIALERSLVLRYSRIDWLRPRVLVLGTGTRAATVEQLVGHEPFGNSFDLVGYLPIKEEDHAVPRGRLLERRDAETLWQMARRFRVTEIVVGVRDRRQGGVPSDELLLCRLYGINVIQLSSFFERQAGQVRLDSLNPSWLIYGEGFRQGFTRTAIKRIFDIVASVSLLIVALPVMILTALAILITMGRPIFYCQQRVGAGGRPFRICKFRSMRNDAEVDGKPQWAQSDDDRVTPLGRVIRKVRIDELPQIFNVLRGEMSFVGPRPERPEFVEHLDQEIPFYGSRHSIKPGITGWAQVRYVYGASFEDAREKLQYDLYYVKNHTLFLDLMILFDTFQVVLFGKGAR